MMEIGISTRPKKGEDVNGDANIHLELSQYHLIAVIDGLGHGVHAHEASEKTRQLIENNVDMNPEELFSLIHQELNDTRGAAAAMMKITPEKHLIEFLGVGNVEMDSTNKGIRPFSVGGILGHRWKTPTLFQYEYQEGDIFIMFSDGISRRFDIQDLNGINCKSIADTLMHDYGRDHDDATVAVVRM